MGYWIRKQLYGHVALFYSEMTVSGQNDPRPKCSEPKKPRVIGAGSNLKRGAQIPARIAGKNF